LLPSSHVHASVDPSYFIKYSFPLAFSHRLTQGHADGVINGETAPGVQDGGRPKSEINIIKMLLLDASSYCEVTKTCCMVLIIEN